MADYEQMEIDVRLDSERDLKDNITKVVTFTYNSQNLEAEKAGREVKLCAISMKDMELQPRRSIKFRTRRRM